MVSTIGLRELRQQASELVRRVEAGEEITITVAGRPSARLVAVTPQRWRRWEDVRELFRGPEDTAWKDDRERVDQAVRDPWTAR
jgi:prevent-host-death family protein